MAKEEFRQVGVDAEGNTLYQKITVDAEKKQDDRPADNTHHLPPNVKMKQAKVSGRKVERNSDFLYEDMDPELIKLRHEQSQEQFPTLKLLEKEFVLKVVHRHPIGVIVIWVLTTIVTLLLTGVWMILLSQNSAANNVHQELWSMTTGMIIIGSIVLIAAMFAVIFTRVYRANRLIITTERVVQVISNGLFDTKIQMIDLAWVEDVSYHQKGFFASTINYGSVRLSTIGDETTYYFVLAPTPQRISTRINDIVFAVKNEYPLSDRELKE